MPVYFYPRFTVTVVCSTTDTELDKAHMVSAHLENQHVRTEEIAY